MNRTATVWTWSWLLVGLLAMLPAAQSEEPQQPAQPEAAAGAAQPAEADGWVELFNGQNLDGWVQRGGKAVYRVEDGQIVGNSVPNTGNSFLCTARDYGDFILELDFKVDPELNSGVQIRSHCFEEPQTVDLGDRKMDIPAGRVHGYQVEIDPAERAWSGGIYDEGRRGWLNNLQDNDSARMAFRPGDWNHFRIECRGDSIKTWINGVPAADLKDGVTPSGFIALQVHGVGGRTDPLEVRWRNIRLQELSAASSTGETPESEPRENNPTNGEKAADAEPANRGADSDAN